MNTEYRPLINRVLCGETKTRGPWKEGCGILFGEFVETSQMEITLN
jgi:hypothetical protein